jgi:hypothetical protein
VAPIVASSESNLANPPNVPDHAGVAPTTSVSATAHAPHFGAHPLVVEKLHTPPVVKPPSQTQSDGENPFDRRH